MQPVGDLYYLYPTTTEVVNITEVYGYNWMGAFGYYFNNFAISDGDGLGAVTVAEADPNTVLPSITAGSKVQFWMDYYGDFFAAKVLEAGESQGYSYVAAWYQPLNKDEYGVTDTTWYIQTVNAEGEVITYPTTATAAGATGVFQINLNSDGVATLSTPGKTLTKGSTTRYISDGVSTYYVTSDTDIYYVRYTTPGTLSTIKVASSSSLSGAATGDNLYVAVTSTGSAYNVDTMWILGTAPTTTSSGSYIYLNGSGFAWASGYMDVTSDDVDDPYFTVYIDGESASNTYLYVDGTIVHSTWATPGFYTYSVNSYGQYVLTAVNPQTATSGTKAISTTLTGGELYQGRLYISDDTTAATDGASVSATIVNLSGYAANGRDVTIESTADIEALLADGLTVSVAYMASYSSSYGWVPTGVIYVTAVA